MIHSELLKILRGLRALITEDEVTVAMDLEYTLRNAGYGIAGLASNLASSYIVLQAGGIDFAVLDINLGEENVFPLARKLQALKVPFFFLTGYSSEYPIPEELQNHECLEKPFTDERLLRAVAELFT